MAGDFGSRLRGVAAGIIEAAASVRASTQELWNELRPALVEAGFVDPRGGMHIGSAGLDIVRQLRSEAVSRRVGYERFQRADTGDLFTWQMAAPAQNVRSATQRAIQPEYLARFDLTYLDPSGSQRTQVVSLRDVWTPGMTVGDVYDAVQEAAEGLALSYGQGLVGVANVRPVMI